MFKNTVLAFSVYLLPVLTIAQSAEIKSVLQEIERNNQELKAYSELIRSNQFELKAENNLPDPVGGVYYLPWGDHTADEISDDAYTEFQITQSFEFPTVYIARSNLIKKQEDRLQLEFETIRQKILLEATTYCQEIIFLNKCLNVEKKRVQQAEIVYKQIRELFDMEQVGILELNKAKVSWMKEQFRIEQIENNKRNIHKKLQNLNGGNIIGFDQSDYAEDLNLEEKDSIWQEKIFIDPEIQSLKQQEEIALHQLKLSKNKVLPDLTAGFNQQGIPGSVYSGIYAGISIPIWNDRKKIRMAEANLSYRENYTAAKLMIMGSAFENKYYDYRLLLDMYNEYRNTLSDLNNEELLLEAYELGEISFIEYYMELQFYRQAYDAMLEMEKNINQLKSEILMHQL